MATVTVTHSKVSAIANDPNAVANGEVVPTDWNASHVVVGLDQINNTSDVNKPVSTAQAAADALVASNAATALAAEAVLARNATNLSSGTVPVARLPGAGTPMDTSAWPVFGSSASTWNVANADGSAVTTSSTTTQGIQEAVNASFTGIGTQNSDLVIHGGNNSTGGADTVQLSTTLNFPVSQGKRVEIGSVTLNSNSGVGATPGINFDSQEMMEFSLKGGQTVYQGTVAGTGIRFKPSGGTPLDNQHTVGDSSFWFTAPSDIAFDWTGNAGVGTGATNNYFDFGELNYSDAQHGTAAGGPFFVPSVAAGQNFGFNMFRSRHVHGVLGTGTVWKVGNGAPAGGQTFGGNMYQLNISPDSSTSANGVDTYESNSLYAVNITGITGGIPINLRSGANNNVIINPINSAVANDVDSGTGNIFIGRGRGEIYVGSGGRVALGSNVTVNWNNDAYLGRAGAAKVMLGQADAAAPVAQTLSTQNVIAGTSNTAGAALSIAGSQGTGTGLGGAINLRVAPAGTTGTAQNALVTGASLIPQASAPGGMTWAQGVGPFTPWSSSVAEWRTGTDQRFALGAANLLANGVSFNVFNDAISLNLGLEFRANTTAFTQGGIHVSGTPTTQGVGVILASSSIKSSGAAGGIGYATGAGGTVSQATSKATGVSLNAASGAITMNAAALAAATIVSFVLTDTSIAATDVLILNHISGGTPGSYSLNARCAAGSATIDVRNNTAGSLSEAIVIQFALIKGVNA